MLFSSLAFIFGFLPVALCGFTVTARFGRRIAGVWLVAASLVFYGWWSPPAVLLLLASIAANYAIATLILLNSDRPRRQTALLASGIGFNLSALFYYKYLSAIVSVLHDHFSTIPPLDPIVLPLGISFFSFTQIGYLVDCRSGAASDRSLLNYMLFVTFFPHLIAGPILHNRDIMPQFASARTYRQSSENLAVGLTIFVIGLLKKVAGADPLSDWVVTGYAHTANGDAIFAWNVALCYSLQLYFDFSGYSDMAIGLARMVNVRFPRNFESPYKAQDIIEYWQRWHISLTQFLTTYLYTPLALRIMRWRMRRRLGINRKAQLTASGFASMFAVPLMTTMTLAGIWHGSGLTFMIFGVLHGAYLCICHAWRLVFPNRRSQAFHAHLIRCALTYLSVLVASVFFRAPSITAALDILGGMTGRHGVDLSGMPFGRTHLLHVALLYIIVWLCPNTQQIMCRYEPVLGAVEPVPPLPLQWRPGWPAACAVGCAAALGVLLLGGTTEFLYFQF